MDPNGNTNNILEEILFDILTLLPVKSLSRFRCVSKHWLSIISDPNFVAAHLSRSKSRPKLLLSVRTKFVSHDKMSFYSIEYLEEDQRPPGGRLHATAHGSIEHIKYCYRGISTSASGLICYNSNQGIRIGNPITREFNLVLHRYTSPNDHFVRYYLGFDPIEKRDVVLELDYSFRMRKYRLFLESRWHDIPPPSQPFSLPGESAICINGVIYFTAHYRSSDDICLYAFDVRFKCFEMIHGFRTAKSTVQVIEYKDRVALVCSKYRDGVRHHKLWILEDPKKHTWSCKSFAVPWPEGGNDRRLIRSELCGATHRGELMFVTELSTEGSLQLFLFEIDTNTLRMFQVDGFGLTVFEHRTVQLRFLIESLHSPNKSNLSIPI